MARAWHPHGGPSDNDPRHTMRYDRPVFPQLETSAEIDNGLRRTKEDRWLTGFIRRARGTFTEEAVWPADHELKADLHVAVKYERSRGRV